MDSPAAVLFDFGNTLFAHASLRDTIAACAVDAGVRCDADALAAAIDDAAMAAEERALGRDLSADVWDSRWRVLYGAADASAPGLGERIHTAMHDPMQWHPYASTTNVLRVLSAAGVRIGVVSNTGWDVRAVFAAHHVGHLVDEFVLSYEVQLVKPDPRIFALACTRLGSLPNTTLMVGDDPHADSGATVAGLRTLLLPAGSPGSDNGLDAVAHLAAS